jgi:hypothetical protein
MCKLHTFIVFYPEKIVPVPPGGNKMVGNTVSQSTDQYLGLEYLFVIVLGAGKQEKCSLFYIKIIIVICTNSLNLKNGVTEKIVIVFMVS